MWQEVEYWTIGLRWFLLMKKKKWINCYIPPGVVENNVPPGVDEYTSGIWDASRIIIVFDGITWAWELQAWRAIGDADIFFFFQKSFFLLLIILFLYLSLSYFGMIIYSHLVWVQ